MSRLVAFRQFSLYLVVGGVAFFVDIGVFAALYGLGAPWLPSSIISFTLATVANYWLSYQLAFRRGRFQRSGEIARLFGVALVGLALNTLFVWLFIASAMFEPTLAKVAAVPLVLIWNFLGRRLLVFHKEMPSGPDQVTSAWMDHALGALSSRAGPRQRGGRNAAILLGQDGSMPVPCERTTSEQLALRRDL